MRTIIDFKKAVLLVLIFGLLYAGTTSVFGVQGATSIAKGETSRASFSDDSTASTAVQSGNVTQLNISGYAITDHWAGFYGEVSGNITLGNSAGNMFYQWEGLNAIAGEVFASTSNSVDWTTIACIDATGIQTLETALGIVPTDADRINQTYTTSAHPAITVAGTAISGCNATNAYINTGKDATTFYQLLLADTAGAGTAVFATLINESTTGFDGVAHDFQLLVGESDAAGTTDLYFYIELN
ncbi:hypothetical protein JW756_05840 [Candidatus Woesearchaeota archaeon]|nr:hypothetical protein [Candidatus Woesearchaeota archaeon]